MKLDSRIIEGKRPLTCFDSEFAKQFIGKKGFVTDFLKDFCNLNKIKMSELRNVWPNDTDCFVTSVTGYKYFLPAEWVKEPEPQWRAFKDHAEYKEFLNDGVIEDWVKIKNKTTNEIYELMYVGGGGDKIILGGMIFSVSRLFRDFELFNECAREWLPFGVEGEE